MTASDPIQLAREGLELVAKATPGPWFADAPNGSVYTKGDCDKCCDDSDDEGTHEEAIFEDKEAVKYGSTGVHNIDFIAWVRNNFEAIAEALINSDEQTDLWQTTANAHWAAVEELDRKLAEAQKGHFK